MLAQPVLPVDGGRVRAALAAAGGAEWYADGAGRFMAETDQGVVHAHLDPARPAALVFRCRWGRRLSVDHQARVRELLDAANRTTDGPRLALTITDRGHLAVVAECAHWLPAGASDGQLEHLATRAMTALPLALRRLDAAFPDPYGTPA